MSTTQEKTGVSLLTTEDQRKKVTEIKAALANPKLKEGSDEYQQLEDEIATLPEEMRKDVGNITNQRNRLLITSCVDDFIEQNKMMPSVLQIAAATGLTHTTVYKHLKRLQNENCFEEELLAFGSQYGCFLNIIAKAAKSGDIKAAKMSIDLLTKPKPTTAIQINNNKTEIALQALMALLPKDQLAVAQTIVKSITNTTDDFSEAVEVIENEPTKTVENEN